MAEKVDRLTRINELMKRALAEQIERDIDIPSGMLVSVTEVRTSVDLRNATVEVSIFGGKASDRHGALKALSMARPEIQRKMARDLQFKHTPVLEFRLDTRTAKGDQVLELLSGEESKSDE